MTKHSADENAKFNAWLLERKGHLVTVVRGDPKWNAASVKNVADRTRPTK